MSRFLAYRVFEEDSGWKGRVVERDVSELPPNEVLIDVHFSSLNFKDALSAHGNRGVTRQYPHTPGIDAAGIVVDSVDPELRPGDPVLVVGFDLGMNTSGGFSQRIRVPAKWVCRLPPLLSLQDAMGIGTAGITAALSVEKLLTMGLPSGSDVVVTGASGGVGCLGVLLLSRLGYQVTAVTGKADRTQWLKDLGAVEVLPREALAESNGKALLAERWSGGLDVVGGETLVNLLKSARYGGSVAACGLVGDAGLPGAAVFPFILRSVNLLGVDSANASRSHKQALWERLASDWKLDLGAVTETIGFAELGERLEALRAGAACGRTVLDTRR